MDAASAHADKDAVPEVCFFFPNEQLSQLDQVELSLRGALTAFEGSTEGTIANEDGIQADDQPFQVHLSDESFETYELDPPPYTMETTKKELKQMYYDMVSVR